MDVDELARITGTLVAAIVDAKPAPRNTASIRSSARSCATRARCTSCYSMRSPIYKALSTEYYRCLSDAANNSIEQLEALAQLPDGRMQ
jgi:hypothetical protein